MCMKYIYIYQTQTIKRKRGKGTEIRNVENLWNLSDKIYRFG